LLRELYLERIAAHAKIPVDRLRAESHARPVPRPAGVAPPATTADATERELLALLLAHELWVEQAAKELAPELFLDPAARELYQALLDAQAHGGRDADDAWAARLSPAAQELLGQLRRELAAVAPAAAQVFEDAVRRLRARPLAAQLAEVEAALARATDETVRERLLREKEALVQRMRADGLLDRRWRAVLRPEGE